MKKKIFTALGLMTGTSMDGVDLSLIKSDGQEEFNFYHDNEFRQYYLYEPDNLNQNSPLVFVLHGYTSSAITIMNC